MGNYIIPIKTGQTGKELYEFVQSTISTLSLSIEVNIQWYDKFILYLKQIASETNTDVPSSVSEKLTALLNDSLLVINNQNILSQFTIDICIGLKEIILSSELLEQIYHINNAYIIIFKELEKYTKSENLVLNQLILRYPKANSEYEMFIERNKLFHNKYDSHVRHIRTKIAAHFEKDYDYKEYYKQISNYKIEDVVDMLKDFTGKLSFRSKVYTVLLEHLSKSSNEIISEFYKEFYSL